MHGRKAFLILGCFLFAVSWVASGAAALRPHSGISYKSEGATFHNFGEVAEKFDNEDRLLDETEKSARRPPAHIVRIE
ncbi:MAG: hypothetical protein KGI97_07295 [Alphaproteobacteria bacterium]|nr:hypothetical protein [Alphaproteobacteria bacterium]